MTFYRGHASYKTLEDFVRGAKSRAESAKYGDKQVDMTRLGDALLSMADENNREELREIFREIQSINGTVRYMLDLFADLAEWLGSIEAAVTHAEDGDANDS